MSRSITLRLILAFLLVGITVVALASGITYWLTVREFKQLTFDQARDRFAAEMTFYYESHGGWDGVLNYYQLRSAVRSPFEMQMNGRQEPGGGPRQRLFFALAGADGRVLIPAGDYRRRPARSGRPHFRRARPSRSTTSAWARVLLVGSPPPLGRIGGPLSHTHQPGAAVRGAGSFGSGTGAGHRAGAGGDAPDPRSNDRDPRHGAG